jgi:hypothetical protein
MSISVSRSCTHREHGMATPREFDEVAALERTKGWRQADHGVRIARDLSAFNGFAGKALGRSCMMRRLSAVNGHAVRRQGRTQHHLLLTAHQNAARDLPRGCRGSRRRRARLSPLASAQATGRRAVAARIGKSLALIIREQGDVGTK